MRECPFCRSALSDDTCADYEIALAVRGEPTALYEDHLLAAAALYCMKINAERDEEEAARPLP